jgi:hypothetical protein
MTLPIVLFQKWIHSHEDDRDDIRVYRPVDYDFPPARGRDGLAFRSDGVYVRSPIAPTDGNLEVIGTWRLISSGQPPTIELQLPNQAANTVILVSCSADRLELQWNDN